MSASDIYPLGLIASQKITPVNSVLADAFEAGNTSTRKLWAANNFKRQIEIQHASLTLAEWRHLRSFFSQRDGTYDSFWYRDNINRGGNILCRFAENIAHQHDDFLFNAAVKLSEISPIRALPEWDEVQTAAGFTPVLWYDANREFEVHHQGLYLADPAGAVYDACNQHYPAPWKAGDPDFSVTRAAQYQSYHFNSGNFARTDATIAEIVPVSGHEPACTLFCIAASATSSAKQVIFGLGAMGAGKALGLTLAADNKFEPWLGGSETWTNTRVTNSTAAQSLAVVWTFDSTTVKVYKNAALVGTDTVTRNLTPGPFAFGSALDLSLPAVNSLVGNVLVFAGELSLAQIKALHNLLGYQYGLATV